MKMTVREHLAVVLAAIVLTVYFTWPLAARPANLGRTDSYDGQFSIWNIAWVAHAILSADARVYDANIFYPNRGTLAYSEANLGAGVLAVPAYWFNRNPYSALNVAYLLGLVMAFIGMYMLARRLSGSRGGALVAAILFTFCPFLFAHTAHIQLVMIGPLPFVLLALHELADRPVWSRALLLGVALAVQALFCAYWGVLAGLVVGTGVLFFAVSRGLWRSPRWWTLALAAAAVSIVIVLPFFLPYVHVQHDGFGRSLDESRRFSATWRDYLTSSARLHRWMLPALTRWGGWTEVLFPGFVSAVLGGAGCYLMLRGNRPAHTPAARETAAFYLLIALMALWSSFGPGAGLYALLYYALPVFSMLRAPARFGIAVILALAVMSAFAVRALLAEQPMRRRRWIVTAIAGVAVVDLSTQMPFREVEPFAKVYPTIANSRRGVVAEFPFFYRFGDFNRHCLYLLASTVHWQSLVNGYSDHIPQEFIDMAVPLSSFPNPEGFDILRSKRARYVVFHLSLYSRSAREALLYRINAYQKYLKPVLQDGDIWLYEIIGWPTEHPDLTLGVPK